MGLPIILFGDQFYWFGIIISLACLTLAYFYHLQYQDMTFKILPTKRVLRRILTQQYVGTPKNGRLFLFVKEHYALLKIENEICIDSAIKNHGTGFLDKATREIKIAIMVFMLVLFVFYGLVMLTISFVGHSEFCIVFLVISIFLLLYYFEPVYRKFFPRDDTDMKEKLKCTCAYPSVK